MNAEQSKRFQNWLGKLNAKCPLCGENKWVPGEIVMPVTYTMPGEGRATPIPEVQLICARCAYVIHFAAMPIGILPK